MQPSLLDTDTLSEVMKARNPAVGVRAREYLGAFGTFTFSIVTQYEILRGLRAKGALHQISAFEEQCRVSRVLALSEDAVRVAAEIYGKLYRRGELLPDADILIAATALVNGLTLTTGNTQHFRRIENLVVDSWHVNG